MRLQVDRFKKMFQTEHFIVKKKQQQQQQNPFP